MWERNVKYFFFLLQSYLSVSIFTLSKLLVLQFESFPLLFYLLYKIFLFLLIDTLHYYSICQHFKFQRFDAAAACNIINYISLDLTRAYLTNLQLYNMGSIRSYYAL